MEILKQSEEQMKKTIERLLSDFGALRTGRAHISLVENIKVEYYGSMMPMNQVGSISVSDARTIEIKPWDAGALKSIETAILKSDVGITPQSDGKLIRLALPAPTEERRKELVKVVKKQAEDYRVQVRNARRDAVESLKKSEKEKQLTQDDLRRLEQDVQRLTDSFIKKIEDILQAKEKEIMEI